MQSLLIYQILKKRVQAVVLNQSTIFIVNICSLIRQKDFKLYFGECDYILFLWHTNRIPHFVKRRYK